MSRLGNDRWQAEFTVVEIGAVRIHRSPRGWIASRRGTTIWCAGPAPEDIAVALAVGAGIIASRSRARAGRRCPRLRAWAKELAGAGTLGARRERALEPGVERAHRAVSRPQPAKP